MNMKKIYPGASNASPKTSVLSSGFQKSILTSQERCLVVAEKFLASKEWVAASSKETINPSEIADVVAAFLKNYIKGNESAGKWKITAPNSFHGINVTLNGKLLIALKIKKTGSGVDFPTIMSCERHVDRGYGVMDAYLDSHLDMTYLIGGIVEKIDCPKGQSPLGALSALGL